MTREYEEEKGKGAAEANFMAGASLTRRFDVRSAVVLSTPGDKNLRRVVDVNNKTREESFLRRGKTRRH